MQKVIALIRKFITTGTPVQKSKIQTATAKSNGDRTIELIFPYGSYGVPPKGSTGIAFNVMAQEENKAGIAYNPALIPDEVMNQKEGEIIVGNFFKGTTIFFNDDSQIIINTNKDVIVNSDSTETNATQSVTVNTSVAEINCDNATINASSSAKVVSPSIDLNNGEFILSGGSATFTVPVTFLGAAAFTGGISSNGTDIGEGHAHTPGSMQAGGDSVTGNSGGVA